MGGLRVKFTLVKLRGDVASHNAGLGLNQGCVGVRSTLVLHLGLVGLWTSPTWQLTFKDRFKLGLVIGTLFTRVSVVCVGVDTVSFLGEAKVGDSFLGTCLVANRFALKGDLGGLSARIGEFNSLCTSRHFSDNCNRRCRSFCSFIFLLMSNVFGRLAALPRISLFMTLAGSSSVALGFNAGGFVSLEPWFMSLSTIRSEPL